MGVGAGVEFGDQVEHLLRRGVGRKIVAERLDADLRASADLVAHIDGGSRIGADHDDGEAGRHAALFQDVHTLPDLCPHRGRNGNTIDDFGGHWLGRMPQLGVAAGSGERRCGLLHPRRRVGNPRRRIT